MARSQRPAAPTPNELREQYAEHFKARESTDITIRRPHRYDIAGYCNVCGAQLEWLEEG